LKLPGFYIVGQIVLVSEYELFFVRFIMSIINGILFNDFSTGGTDSTS